MNVGIITIGDELLLGHTIDTNSVWLAKTLEPIGANIKYKLTISDEESAIMEAIQFLKNKVSIVMISGGLGPTNDDITKKVLAKYFNASLVRNELVLKHIEYLYSKRKRPILESVKSQADVPENCEVLFNEYGTAPGMLWKENGTVVISLPGVPYEFTKIVESEVVPRLKNEENKSLHKHQFLQLYGIGESVVAELIQDIENALPAYIHLAYLPKGRRLILRLTEVSSNFLSKELNLYTSLIHERIKPYVVSTNDESMEFELVKKLTELRMTISTAESCTGGFLSSKLTDISGASQVYLGSVVAYDNEIKEKLLSVPSGILLEHGAVSQETVEAMASESLKLFGTDLAISISGILGPLGGSESKPVGTVWIAWAHADKVWSESVRFNFDRLTNKQWVVEHAIIKMLQYLSEWEFSNS